MSLQFYSEKEDNINEEESIDKHKDCFIEYLNNLPTLKEALEQLFISEGATKEESNNLIEDIMNKCQEVMNRNFEKITQKYQNISREEAEIIASYTCESENKKYNPYKVLNTNLTSDDREKGIKNVSKYFYILLKALRKLPRYYPNNNKPYLYRCIKKKVSINYDQFNKKLVPYIEGNIKTFWAFTSTSPDLILDFLGEDKNKDIKCGTIFTLVGKVWGYDITLFNYYKEEEVLLEPERKFKVEQIIPPVNEIINIRCSLLDTPLVIEKFDKIDRYKHILVNKLLLSRNNLDSKGDKSEGWSINQIRGKEKYIPPLNGWVGIGLKVLNKYENNDWISNKNIKGEYSVAYYGINWDLDGKNVENKDKKDLTKIISEKIFVNEEDKRSGFIFRNKCGEGATLFQDPKNAEFSAGEIKLDGFLYKIILMCRVNPSKIRQPLVHDKFWILNPTPNEIRPYRILMKRIEHEDLLEEKRIIVCRTPVDYIIDAINSNDYSFYKIKLQPEFNKFFPKDILDVELGNDFFVMKLYSSIYSKFINLYIHNKKIQVKTKDFLGRSIRGFNQEELNSWICCLQKAIKRNKNVPNGTKVYRALRQKFSNNINIGSKFFFPEFVSTTKNYKLAGTFLGGNGTIISIDIENNGTDDNHPNYCCDITGCSVYPEEEVIVFSSHCYYQVTNIKRNEKIDYVDLVCLGYLLINHK